MASKQPPFKRCLDCADKMAISDGHSLCLYCRSEAHQPWICQLCRAFSKLELKDRKCDLMDRALQPADLASSHPPPRPLALGYKKISKKVSMEKAVAESLKPLEEDRISNGSENLAVQSDRPSASKPQMPNPQPAKRKRPASGSPPLQPACQEDGVDQSPERKKQKTKEDEEAKEKGTARKMGKEEKKERKKTSDKREKPEGHEGESGRKRKRCPSPVQITAGSEPVSIVEDDNLDEETFSTCKEIIRPVKRALKQLENPGKGLSLLEEVECTRISLLKIGDHISKYLKKTYSDQEEISLWRTMPPKKDGNFVRLSLKKKTHMKGFALRGKQLRKQVKYCSENNQQGPQEEEVYFHVQSPECGLFCPPESMEPLYSLGQDGKARETTLEVFQALKELGYTSFRPGQEAAVMRILSGETLGSRLLMLLVLSTGMGKSLSYQLQAYACSQRSKCVMLVISPSVSLMDDQVSGLPRCLKAICLHWNMSKNRRAAALEKVSQLMERPKSSSCRRTKAVLSSVLSLGSSLELSERAREQLEFLVQRSHSAREGNSAVVASALPTLWCKETDVAHHLDIPEAEGIAGRSTAVP
ncbi:uncharacterized protein LOC144584623 [Pogona vitticeps]